MDVLTCARASSRPITHGRPGVASAAPCAAQFERERFPNFLVRRCSMPNTSESREGVCRCRCFSGYTLYATEGYDTHVGLGWSPPGLCAPASPRGPHPPQGSVCLGFPSPVSPLEAWRKTSGSADVEGLAPCPICRPVSPSRYALGADAQGCEPAAT